MQFPFSNYHLGSIIVKLVKDLSRFDKPTILKGQPMQYHINSIEQIKEEFELVKSRTMSLFQDLSNEQYNFKPAPDMWSAAECLEHLVLTGSGYLKNIQTANHGDNENAISSTPIYKPRFLFKKFAILTGPDSKLKMPSPKFLQSASSVLDKEVIEKFIGIQEEFLSIISQIHFEQLKKIKISWPAFPLIKLQLGEVFIMTAAHENRHINQAEQAIIMYANLNK